jgi:hypothetical protein
VEEKIPQDLDEKRIDLSQFDAITPGNWEVIETPSGGIDIGVRIGDNAHRHIITFTESLGEQAKKLDRDVADMNAIAAVPSLIAQLKICYEAIDHIKDALLEQTQTNILLEKLREAKSGLIKEALSAFKEDLWREAICDESENLIHNRGEEGFFISAKLVNKMYDYFSMMTRV